MARHCGSSKRVLVMCSAWLPLTLRPSKQYKLNSWPAIAVASSDVPGSMPPPCGAIMAIGAELGQAVMW